MSNETAKSGDPYKLDLSPMMFSTKLQEVPVVLDAEDGAVACVLRQPDNDVAATWNARNISNVRGTPGKGISILPDMAKSEMHLVSLCLRYDTPERKLVGEAKIKKLPAHVVKQLFERAKQLGNLQDTREGKKGDRTLEELKKERDALDVQIAKKEGGETPSESKS